MIIRLTTGSLDPGQRWIEVGNVTSYIGPRLHLLVSDGWCRSVKLVGEGAAVHSYELSVGDNTCYLQPLPRTVSAKVSSVTINMKLPVGLVEYPEIILDVGVPNGEFEGLEILWPEESQTAAPDLATILRRRRDNR